MPYTIYVTPTAADNLSAAIEYYNTLSPGFGYKFADIIGGYFERIAIPPTAFAIRYQNVPCKPVIKFPFIITYTVEDKEMAVQILRVFNTYLDPRHL